MRANDECQSGYCVDGVCCGRACDGICESCNGGLTDDYLGVCVAVPLGEDPEQECTVLQGCNGQRACSLGDAVGSLCELGGTCATGQCVDGVCCSAACEQSCMACVSTLTGVSDGQCAAVLVGLNSAQDCAFTQGCDGDGACLPGYALGEECAEDGNCISGHCTDGVCCDDVCDGQCVACVAVLSGLTDGVCAAIPELEDYEDECSGALACSGLPTCQRELGAACTENQECEAKYCASNLCTALPSILAPQPYFPPNGHFTGSVHVTKSLRPRFRWRAASGGVGALTYQFQVDDSCANDTFRSCAFASPEVDQTLAVLDHTLTASLPVSINKPVGRRYFWRVRACDSLESCSPWSEVRYLEVGRLRKDINGDGYEDFAVGSSLHSRPGIKGGAALYYGSPPGFTGSPAAAAWIEQPANPNTGFATESMALGDVNADGFADLAVGAPFYVGTDARTHGAVFVYYGGAFGLAATPTILVGPQAAFTQFGKRVAFLGDVNGDGFGDLGVSAEQASNGVTNEGNVYLYWGREEALSTSPSRTLDSPDNLTQTRFGHELIGGDVDGDGLSDAVICDVSNPSTGVYRGRVYIYQGRRSGLLQLDITIHNPRGVDLGGFGSGVQVADMNADGSMDLLVGVPVDADGPNLGGAVLIMAGPILGEQPDFIRVGPQALSVIGFGTKFDVGSFTNDHYPDLLVSAPFQSSTAQFAGEVYRVTNTAAGFAMPVSILLGTQETQLLGSVVATVGDLTGTGIDAFAFKASGSVVNLYGSAGAYPTNTPTATMLNLIDTSGNAPMGTSIE